MKIFYVDRFDHALAFMFDHLQEIASQKKDFEILFIGPDEKNVLKETYDTSKYESHIRRIWHYNDYVLKIYNYVRKLKPSVIHFNFEIRLFGSLRSALKFPFLLMLIMSTKTRIIVTLHTIFVIKEDNVWKTLQDNPINLPSWLIKLLIKIFVKTIGFFSNKIVVYTQSAKHGLTEYFGIDEKKIHVMNLAIVSNSNPINLEKKRKFEEQFSGKKIILIFGTISPRKGIETAIKALKIVSQILPNHILVIAGESTIYNKPYEDMLKAMPKELSIEDRIFFAGFLDEDELKILFEMAEMIIYPYKPSSAGTTALLHGIQHHKPLIVTRIDTFKEILSEDEALFINPDDEEQLAEAITHIAKEEKMRTDLAQKLERISNKFSWARTAGDYIQLYETLSRTDYKS